MNGRHALKRLKVEERMLNFAGKKLNCFKFYSNDWTLTQRVKSSVQVNGAAHHSRVPDTSRCVRYMRTSNSIWW